MKSILLLFMWFSFQCVSQTQLKAYLDTKQFHAPGTGSYLEIHIEFAGYTVQFQPCVGGSKATVLVDISLKDSTQQIVFKDLYTLDSPISTDSSQNNFIEILRTSVKPGTYFLDVYLEDINRPKSSIKGVIPVEIVALDRQLAFSSVEIVDLAFKSDEDSRFVKSGYYMLPLLSNYFNQDMSALPFYTELYGSKGGIVLERKVVDAKTNQNFALLQRKDTLRAESVIPILQEINISDLPTGSYQLQLTATDLTNQQKAAQTYEFERNNDIETAFDFASMLLDPSFQASIHTDSIAYYFESLIPIAKPGEIRTIIDVLKSKDTIAMRKHLQAFWFQTAGSKGYEKWIQYREQVRSVEKYYANNYMEGFETDRGRVYLKYGQPNSVVVKESSPSEYPYEIWTYDKIGIYSNKRFVFYNPDLITNNHRLLHSDMIGELKNPAWQQALNRRNTVNGTVDDPNMMNVKHFGGNSADFYRQY
ncbi:MAG: GWxTD domain-containing protein [Flavobacteriales bacterium]